MLDDLVGAAPALISNTMLPTTLGSAGLLPPPDTGTAGAVGATGAVGALGSTGLLPPPDTGMTGAVGAAAVVVGGAASLQASSAAATALREI